VPAYCKSLRDRSMTVAALNLSDRCCQWY